MTSRRFFSLGVSAIADAIRAKRRVVFVIHTEDPAEALGPRRRWQRRPKVNTLDIQSIVESIGTGQRDLRPGITTIDPSDRERTKRLLERLVLRDGVQVVIARRRRGPRYYRKASEIHQKQSARRGYLAKQGCLVHCPEAGPLSPRRRIELGVLGVEATEPTGDPWTVSVSWSWADETVMQSLGEPAVGLAILERSQAERSRVVAEDLDDLPDPSKPMHAQSDAWRATVAGVTGSAFDLTLELLLEAGAAMGYLVRSTRAPDFPDEPAACVADILFTRHLPANAPHVPASPGRSAAPVLTASPLSDYGDLFLGTEMTESARQLMRRHSGAMPAQAPVLTDTLVIPDLASLELGSQPGLDVLMAPFLLTGPEHGNPAYAAALPIAQLAEWCWGHQRYAAWVYLGYLVQSGLIPLTTTAIDAAGQRVLGVSDPRGSEAVKVGRKLAIDPEYAERALTRVAPEPEALLRTLADDLAEQAGSRRGASLAGTYLALAQPVLDDASVIDAETRRQLVTTAYRCLLWGGPKHGPAYAERFVKTIRHLLPMDDADHDYALTQQSVQGLAAAMLIPDEVYLAALLTAPARYRRDRRRLNVSLERGDKISYIHTLRPEFDLFKRRVGFSVSLGDRALKTLATQYWLRRIRPGWYRSQRAFRDQYIDALMGLAKPNNEAGYNHAAAVAQCAHDLRGRGDTRRASVEAASRRLEKLLNNTEAG